MSVIDDCEEYSVFPSHLEHILLDRVEDASNGCQAAVLTGIYRDIRSGELRLVTGLITERWWSFPVPQEWRRSGDIPPGQHPSPPHGLGIEA